MRISVRPDALMALSTQWQRTADDLHGLIARLDAALSQLDWETRTTANVDERWSYAKRQAYALAEQALDLSRFLQARAQTFEAVDREQSARVASLSERFGRLFQDWDTWWKPVRHLMTFPGHVVGAIFPLGGISVAVTMGTLFTSVYFLDALIGSVLRDITFLRPAPPQWESQFHKTTGYVQKKQPSTRVRPPGHAMPSPPQLRPVDPSKFSSCVIYARTRRPDLGRPGGDGGAYNYITKFKGTSRYYRLPEDVRNLDLRKTPLRPGTAVVWDEKVLGAHPKWGHIAIVERVEKNYVEISESGWKGGTRRRLSIRELVHLHFIL